MARVLTNDITISYALEDEDEDFGVLPASPLWKQLEPNDISKWGAEIKTVSRNPISKNRQVRKGTITDLDSAVELKVDLTLDSMIDFIEGFVFAQANGYAARASHVIASGDKFTLADGETVSSTVVAGSLIFTRGFTNTGNNGLNVVTSVGAGVAASKVFTLATAQNAVANETITIGTTVYTWKADGSGAAYTVTIGADNDGSVINLVKAINATGLAGTDYGVGTLIHPDVTAGVETGDSTTTITANVAGTAGNAIALAETMTQGSWAGGAVFLSGGTQAYIAATAATTVDEAVASDQYATIELAGYRTASGDIDVNGGGNLTSTLLDFTTLGLTLGQFIYVGHGVGNTLSLLTTANNGFARVMGIAANLLTLDKKLTTFATESNTTHAVDLLFGRFIRNVVVDDADYIERRFQFEAEFPGLEGVGSPGFEYSVGNFCDKVTFELPLANKALATFNFIGTDTEPPVAAGSRKTNASTAMQPEQTTAFNTTADVLRLRVAKTDETGLTSDFKEIKIVLDNNVSPEKVIGVLGARFMNNGIFEVDMDTKCLFTDGDVLDAIRNNTTVSMDFALQNTDGGFVVDIPAMTLGDGAKDFPLNATVTVALKGKAFIDPVLGTSLGVSIFPFLP